MTGKQRHILVLDGHPDPAPHLIHALADAYAAGASAAGHRLTHIRITDLDCAVLRRPEDFAQDHAPETIRAQQGALLAADHVLLAYPLWFGSLPAYTKAYLENLLRPGFAFAYQEAGFPKPRLRGKSARILVTMGMPAVAYRLWYRAHSLKSLERNILGFCGIGPIRETLFGRVEAVSDATRAQWIEKMRRLGRRGV